MELVEARTLGAAWLEVARRVVTSGAEASWGGAPTRELALLTLVVAEPDPSDSVIASLGDPDWLRWMHENFFVPQAVEELGGADSYAVRLFDYEHTGRDQLAWVVSRLRADPECRDATITTFQPHTDTTYIPCVSLLDSRLEASAAKPPTPGQTSEKTSSPSPPLRTRVARKLTTSVGRLVLHVKTAHVYEPELELMRGLSSGVARPA